jgi:hypothetical protein
LPGPAACEPSCDGSAGEPQIEIAVHSPAFICAATALS